MFVPHRREGGKAKWVKVQKCERVCLASRALADTYSLSPLDFDLQFTGDLFVVIL